jgi:hypothetical protein
MESAGAGRRKGQAATEFLVMFAASLLVLLLSVAIYFMHITEARMLENALDATSLCVRISSSISSFAALGGQSSYRFDLPEKMNYLNYTVWVNSEKGLVKVDYEDRGIGCSLQARNVTDSEGNTLFQLARNATLLGNNGVVTVEQ